MVINLRKYQYNIFYFYNNNLNVNHPKLGRLMSTTILTAFSISLESQQHPISPKLAEKEVAVIILGERAKKVMFHSAGFPDESNVIFNL